MATDIYGYVEFQDADLNEGAERKQWWAVIDAGIILDRSYAMFGSLFGVRNPTDFVPVASNRGLPDDVSEEVKGNAVLKGNHSYTWITWEELQAIDWNAMGLMYGTERISRRGAFGDSGWLLLALMKPLAERHGEKYVRLVVWFD